MRTQQTNARNAQQSKKKKRFAAVAVAGVIGLATAGGAYSYWTSLGGGTGTASTSAGNSSSVFTVSGDATSPMFPGDKPQTIIPTVTNSGTESYQLQALKVWVETNKTGCDGSDYLVNNAPGPTSAGSAVEVTVAPTDLAPGASVKGTFTMQFNDKGSNQDACKGATVTLNYLAS